MSTKEEIQRLKSLGHKKNTVAKKLGIQWRTVHQYWDGPDNIQTEYQPEWANDVDWDNILSRYSNGVFATTLYEELRDSISNIGSYDAFNRHLKKYVKKEPNIIIKIPKVPGQDLEVDYSGDSIDILSPSTGEILKTELFVGCLPYSDYIYGEFTFTQKLEDFISSHCNMFEHLGGVPLFLVPDNAKVAIKKYHTYDPEANKTYHDMATHYKVGISPARPYHPKDKPSVERAVGLIQQHFFPSVKDRTFTSLGELNQALKEWLLKFNQRKMKRSGKSRLELFKEESKSLRALPENRYELFYWKNAQVHPDCHFQFDYNYYSVPSKYVSKEIKFKYNQKLVISYYSGEKICTHARLQGHGHYQTNLAHYPEHKMSEQNFNLALAQKKATTVGENMSLVVKRLIDKGAHPLANLRKIQGIVGLQKKYSSESLEYACERALISNKLFYQYINNCAKSYHPEIDLEVNKVPQRDSSLICLQGGYDNE